MAPLAQVFENQRRLRLLQMATFQPSCRRRSRRSRSLPMPRQFAQKWHPKDINKFWTAPELFNIPKYGTSRRNLAIVNPINQLRVASLIATNWLAIRARLRASKVTEFNPSITLAGATRAVTGVDFSAVNTGKAKILSSYGSYIKTDIARFYSSVYTHSVPWALLGKEWVKANLHTAVYKSSFANQIDKAVLAGQSGQTMGIPVGPDTSRILAELIMVAVEELAAAKIDDFERRAIRYVDDIFIGIRHPELYADLVARVSEALHSYELELNSSKTELVGIGVPSPPDWLHFLRTFEVGEGAPRQLDDVTSFFEQAIYLADVNPTENVLLFATRRVAGFEVEDDVVPHVVRWLLYCAQRQASCLPFVTHTIARMSLAGRPVPIDEIREFGLRTVSKAASAAHTCEVAWLLFLFRELKLIAPAAALKEASHLSSSVVALLVLDLEQQGLIQGEVSQSHWRGQANSDGLKSGMWLSAYEATMKGWWRKKCSQSFIQDHPFFGDLKASNVFFYDQARGTKALGPLPFSLKPDDQYN
jgi:hypothetical protein